MVARFDFFLGQHLSERSNAGKTHTYHRSTGIGLEVHLPRSYDTSPTTRADAQTMIPLYEKQVGYSNHRSAM